MAISQSIRGEKRDLKIQNEHAVPQHACLNHRVQAFSHGVPWKIFGNDCPG
jgi:hypothetical protein